MSKSNGTVTLKPIAEALGISFSTVSKVLNGDPTINPQTRVLVEEKAREMHYTRNYYASALRKRDTRSVAIILNDINVPASVEMLVSISAKLAACGYTTLVSSTGCCKEVERSREALIKSARAGSRRFWFSRKFRKRGNTVCISRFWNCTAGAKDSPFGRRRFIQRFPSIQNVISRMPEAIIIAPIHPAADNCIGE